MQKTYNKTNNKDNEINLLLNDQAMEYISAYAEWVEKHSDTIKILRGVINGDNESIFILSDFIKGLKKSDFKASNFDNAVLSTISKIRKWNPEKETGADFLSKIGDTDIVNLVSLYEYKIQNMDIINGQITMPVVEKMKQQSVSEDSIFLGMPSSVASQILYSVIGSKGNLQQLKDRTELISHGSKMKLLSAKIDENNKKIEYHSDSADITIQINDVNDIIGKSNKAAKKMFVFAFMHINDICLNDQGELIKTSFTFPISELIDIGFYKTPQSARAGIKRAFDPLTSLKIGGTFRTKGKNGVEESEATLVLFTSYIRDKKGNCTVDINPRVNWKIFTQYFTWIPRYIFELPDNAFDLLYYICYIARQNTSKIKSRGYFTISFRAIQAKLNLPDETKIKNGKRDIIDAIESAIDQIDALSQTDDFMITPYYNAEGSIKDQLNNGYIKVELKGEYADKFIEFEDGKRSKINLKKKKKEKVVEKAKVKALADKISAQDD